MGAVDFLKRDRLAFMENIQNITIQNNFHQDLSWKYIPPGAPHMGGLWEAGVKSFKNHLRKSMRKMNFTFEEFTTILTRIEACLNSRPLSPACEDPNDLSPFLFGTPILAPPEPNISNKDVSFVNA